MVAIAFVIGLCALLLLAAFHFEHKALVEHPYVETEDLFAEDEHDEDTVEVMFTMKNDDVHYMEYKGTEQEALTAVHELIHEQKIGLIRVNEGTLININEIISIEV